MSAANTHFTCGTQVNKYISVTSIYIYLIFLQHRKVLNKGVLLYVHFNLLLALLLALIVFVSGIESAVHITVRLFVDILHFICFCSGNPIRTHLGLGIWIIHMLSLP